MIVECPGCSRRYDVSGRPPGTQARCRCGEVFPLPEPPQAAGKLACPGCGASVPHTDTTCSYCDAHLAIRACARCFGMLFLGTKFCAACGATAEAPAHALADGRAAPRYCPRCRPTVRLESQLAAGLALDACPSCEGVFVDGEVLERLLAERRHRERQEAAAPHMQTLLFQRTRPAGGTGRPGTGRVYIQCPDCDQHMLRRNFGRTSGVIVDICKHHGTWFDANELDHVIAFVQEGGLDREPGFRAPPALGGVAAPRKVDYGRDRPPLYRREPGFFERAIGALTSFLGA